MVINRSEEQGKDTPVVDSALRGMSSKSEGSKSSNEQGIRKNTFPKSHINNHGAVKRGYSSTEQDVGQRAADNEWDQGGAPGRIGPAPPGSKTPRTGDSSRVKISEEQADHRSDKPIGNKSVKGPDSAWTPR